LFHSASVGGKLSACCNQKVRDLDAYDRAHNLDLCRTLQVYLENGFSLLRTSEILFVHKNTVRYRVEKCMTQLFGGPDRKGDLFSILVSLRILEYEYKFLKH
jgi:DNA-binding PucR family transcriptional regulator